MCLVLFSIIVPLGNTNGFVQGSVGPMPENIQKRFLVSVEMPYMWNNALCPTKIAHKSNACA